jgi:hypothetical protein
MLLNRKINVQGDLRDSCFAPDVLTISSISRQEWAVHDVGLNYDHLERATRCIDCYNSSAGDLYSPGATSTSKPSSSSALSTSISFDVKFWFRTGV